MQNKFNIKFLIKYLGGLLFIIASFSASCQSTDRSDVNALQTGSVEEGLSRKEQVVIQQNSLNQPLDLLDDCDKRFPFPVTAEKSDPYSDKGADICKKLKVRGQRMQCEVDSLLEERPTSNTTGAKIELAAWARCNSKVANLLIEGYYLPASEIERRLQICSSNYYADPGKLPKLGWYQRFLKWYTSNDLTPPPTDAALEVALKQSTPLDSRQDSAGLMKCEWMFNISRIPQVDPLPNSNNNSVESNPAPKALTKKPSKK
jgi:hypothetical protein